MVMMMTRFHYVAVLLLLLLLPLNVAGLFQKFAPCRNLDSTTCFATQFKDEAGKALPVAGSLWVEVDENIVGSGPSWTVETVSEAETTRVGTDPWQLQGSGGTALSASNCTDDPTSGSSVLFTKANTLTGTLRLYQVNVILDSAEGTWGVTWAHTGPDNWLRFQWSSDGCRAVWGRASGGPVTALKAETGFGAWPVNEEITVLVTMTSTSGVVIQAKNAVTGTPLAAFAGDVQSAWPISGLSTYQSPAAGSVFGVFAAGATNIRVTQAIAVDTTSAGSLVQRSCSTVCPMDLLAPSSGWCRCCSSSCPVQGADGETFSTDGCWAAGFCNPNMNNYCASDPASLCDDAREDTRYASMFPPTPEPTPPTPAPTPSEASPLCAARRTCADCLDLTEDPVQEKTCSWCAGGFELAATTGGFCGDSLFVAINCVQLAQGQVGDGTSSQPTGDVCPALETAAPCGQLTDCTACTGNAACGWCILDLDNNGVCTDQSYGTTCTVFTSRKFFTDAGQCPVTIPPTPEPTGHPTLAPTSQPTRAPTPAPTSHPTPPPTSKGPTPPPTPVPVTPTATPETESPTPQPTTPPMDSLCDGLDFDNDLVSICDDKDIDLSEVTGNTLIKYIRKSPESIVHAYVFFEDLQTVRESNIGVLTVQTLDSGAQTSSEIARVTAKSADGSVLTADALGSSPIQVCLKPDASLPEGSLSRLCLASQQQSSSGQYTCVSDAELKPPTVQPAGLAAGLLCGRSSDQFAGDFALLLVGGGPAGSPTPSSPVDPPSDPSTGLIAAIVPIALVLVFLLACCVTAVFLRRRGGPRSQAKATQAATNADVNITRHDGDTFQVEFVDAAESEGDDYYDGDDYGDYMTESVDEGEELREFKKQQKERKHEERRKLKNSGNKLVAGSVGGGGGGGAARHANASTPNRSSNKNRKPSATEQVFVDEDDSYSDGGY